MAINKGGRGKRNDYQTKTKRIPVELEHQIDRLIEEFTTEQASTPDKPVTSLHEAVAAALSILKAKKSAKLSMEKLLQVLYGGDIKL
jgi:hypothetical protein